MTASLCGEVPAEMPFLNVYTCGWWPRINFNKLNKYNEGLLTGCIAEQDNRMLVAWGGGGGEDNPGFVRNLNSHMKTLKTNLVLLFFP